MGIKLNGKFLFFVLLFLICFQPLPAAASDISISVTIFSDTYNGNFSGTVKNDLPNGEGTFSCSDSPCSFTLSGKWNQGLLDGSVSILFDDQRKIYTTYKNGLINGKVEEYFSDGSYRTYDCEDGRPYGLISYYSADDMQTHFDHFYQMQPIADLKSNSEDADYHFLFHSESALKPYKICGSVLAVYEDASSSYILLQDLNSHLYVLNYTDISADTFNQALVPNLVAGEKIIGYGFFQKLDCLSNIESIGFSSLVSYPNDYAADASSLYKQNMDSTLPFIQLFLVEAESGHGFDYLHPTYTYDDVIRNPYFYAGLTCNLSAVVTKSQIVSDSGQLRLSVKELKTSNEFFIQYNYKDSDILPATGDTIEVIGLHFGNYKNPIGDMTVSDPACADLNPYMIYPAIQADTITVIQ